MLQAALAPLQSKFRPAVYRAVDEELDEAASVRHSSPERRRHLLQVFHFCRALDTALKEVIEINGTNPEKTLGRCFRQMLPPPKGEMSLINQSQYDNFYADVCEPRNRFMHEANAFPNSEYETAIHVGNIAACFCEVLKFV